MMEITRKNYEAYFVDYLEGNLDESLVDLFIEFLERNTDLKAELKLFESASIIPEDTTYKNKAKLYKDKFDVEDDFNKAAVERIESEISPQDKRAFDAYLLKHPEKQKDVHLFAKTILKPETDIHYQHKNKLYKKTRGKLVLLWAGRVAAVVVLALGVFSLFNRNNNTVSTDNQLVQTDKMESVQETTPTVEENKEITTTTNKQVIISTPETEAEEKLLVQAEKSIPPANKKIGADKNLIASTTPEEKELIAERLPLEVPEQLQRLNASINSQPANVNLGIMTLIYPNTALGEERLLADNIKEKINPRKISRAGLNLFKSISNERFTYETNSDGKVTEYNYESRLLAFSIPSSGVDKE